MNIDAGKTLADYGSGTSLVKDRRSILILVGCRYRGFASRISGDISREFGKHYSSGDGLGWRVAVVGATIVAWLCCDGSSLLLQHDMVAQGETKVR